MGMIMDGEIQLIQSQILDYMILIFIKAFNKGYSQIILKNYPD